MRELENAVRKGLLLAQGYTINADHIRAALGGSPAPDNAAARPLAEYIDQLLAVAQRGDHGEVHAQVIETAERELFRRAIGLAQGNQAKAARWLGISRITMKAKLVSFDLHPAGNDSNNT